MEKEKYYFIEFIGDVVNYIILFPVSLLALALSLAGAIIINHNAAIAASETFVKVVKMTGITGGILFFIFIVYHIVTSAYDKSLLHNE